MKHLLNTLYVTSNDAYLSLKNDNVVVQQGDITLGKIPLRSLESIMSFSHIPQSTFAFRCLCIDIIGYDNHHFDTSLHF